MKTLFRAWWQSETKRHSIYLLLNHNILAIAALELYGVKLLAFLSQCSPIIGLG